METYKPDMVCPKCGSKNTGVRYNEEKENLGFKCFSCEYYTIMHPADHKEPFKNIWEMYAYVWCKSIFEDVEERDPDFFDALAKKHDNYTVTVSAKIKPMPPTVEVKPGYIIVTGR